MASLRPNMTGPNAHRVPQVKRNEGVCLESLHLRELEAQEKAVLTTWSSNTICLHLRGVLTSPEFGTTSRRQEPTGQPLLPGSSGSGPVWLSILRETLTPSLEDPWIIESQGRGGAEGQVHL